jgi:hypothetical protein
MKLKSTIGYVFVLVLAVGIGQALSDQLSSSPELPPVLVHTGSDGHAAFDDRDLQYPGQAGQPAIPYKIMRLLLPSDTDMASVNVSVTAYDSEPLPGQWNVRPIEPPAVWDGTKHVIEWPAGRRIVDGKDMEIYSNDQKFPASCIGDIGTGTIRHWKLVEVPVALFQYNPVAKTLFRLTTIELVASFDRRTTAADQVLPSSIHHSASAKRARKITLNYDDIVPRDPLYSLRPSAVAAAEPTYAIITTNAIADESSELVNFIRHKEQRGFTVQVVTEDAWGGGVGDAAAENIRSWLKTNYQSLNIEYVLLIGNPHPTAGDVPMKMLWPRLNQGSYRESPSDYYYTDLTGNWDADGDGFFGEWGDDFGANGVDRHWEVRVGRIPYYGHIEDLDDILSKIVHYQNETGDAAQWRKQVLLPMKPSDSSTPGYHLGGAIKDMVLSAQCDWNYHRIYDDDYGLTPPPESVPCTVDTVTAAWKATLPGAVFWWTHGWSQGASSIMDTTHAATLDDDYPVFTFQASCHNSYPEDVSNLSFSLLKNGAIAAIGATRVSWYYPGQTDFSGSPSNSGMTFEYAKRLIEETMDSGTALNDLKESISVNHSALWMNYTVMNIYGDPETGLALEEDMIIDNGDPGTSGSGLWEPCDAHDPYGIDAMCTVEPDARYTYQAPLEGLYAADLWWTGQDDSCSDVSVHIYDGDSYLDTIRIDQSQNSGQWNLLDAFHFSDTAWVVISATGGCITSADAVRFRPRNVLFVDSGNTSSGDGSSWSEAFQSIQEAVDAACGDSEIWVKTGRYRLSAHIDINKTIYLYGGFQGHESDRHERNWEQHATIIDGDGQVQCVLVSADATIDGFVITNGYSSEESSGMSINNGASPIIENVTFYRNDGGGVWNGYNCSSVFRNCAFIENESNGWGGAIMNVYALTISNSRFLRNNARYNGGGIYNWTEDSSAQIVNCIFTDNAKGAIVNYNNQPIITNCTIVGNRDFGIANHNAQLTVSNTILWGNQTEIVHHDNSLISVSYSNVDQEGYAGDNGNIRQNPRFISMADADFRLSAISPCIDSGSNATAAQIATDFEDGPRTIDGNGDGSAIVDMGAVEAFITTTGSSIGIRTLYGTRITHCSPVDPVTIEAMPNRPDNLPQGLIRFGARVHEPGAQAVYRIVLPQPVPQAQKWFMYAADLGWIDFSRETISNNIGDGAEFNDDRSEVTIYITDNGPYDDDPAAGIVADPTGPGTPGLPDLYTDPGTVSFGTVQIGESALQPVAITNQGTVNLEIGEASISGANASEFEIIMDACSGNSFAYSESGTVTIRFSPASPGAKNAAVTIGSNDPDAAVIDVPLNATGIEPPAVTNLEIGGPERVAESSGAQYVCTAYYNDGTSTDVSDTVQWSADSTDVTIDNQGYLSTGEIDGDQQCTLQAVYEDVSQSMVVSIVDSSDKRGGGAGSACFIDALAAQQVGN